ncbi:MAG: DMT family transporter [Oscillospiraceae bacterium]|nr:DMT family transporter [Oscillospiraceae bacterium]
MRKKLQGSLSILLATILWGSTFVAQSVGMDHIGPFTFQAVRCGLGVLAMLPVIFLADRFKNDGKTFCARWKSKKLWTAGILCGIPLFLACNLQQMGIVDTDAGKSAFLTAMYIVIVPILGMFLKKKPSVMIPVSVALAVAGLYFLSFAGVPQISKGDLLLLACALMFAIQITVVDQYVQHVDALRLNLIQALVCTVLSSAVMLLTEAPTFSAILDCWLPLCYAGFLSMGAAYSLQIIGQKHLEPSAASLIMSLESVFAVLCGCLILQERLTTWETLGCVLMFIAVVLSQLPVKSKR